MGNHNTYASIAVIHHLIGPYISLYFSFFSQIRPFTQYFVIVRILNQTFTSTFRKSIPQIPILTQRSQIHHRLPSRRSTHPFRNKQELQRRRNLLLPFSHTF